MSVLRVTLVLVILAMLIGCGPRFDVAPSADPYTVVGPNRKVTVDAYLFDAKVYREGKPTSVRLQFFEAHDMIGMSGRGYLGKGALKGRLTEDSLVAYFPATNEYVREAVVELFVTNGCRVHVDTPRLTHLLASLPDHTILPMAAITIIEEKKKKRKYEIIWLECPWRMNLTYDLRDEGWRLKQLRFDVDGESRFSMKRRVFKPTIEVKRSKLQFQIPDGAIRVSL